MIYIVKAFVWGLYDEILDSWGETFCSHDELIAVIDSLVNDPRFDKTIHSILIDFQREE